MEQSFRLRATFAQGPVFQAVVEDNQGHLFLINPRVGAAMLKKSPEDIEALLSTSKNVHVRRFKASDERTRSELDTYLGAANNLVEGDLSL